MQSEIINKIQSIFTVLQYDGNDTLHKEFVKTLIDKIDNSIVFIINNDDDYKILYDMLTQNPTKNFIIHINNKTSDYNRRFHNKYIVRKYNDITNNKLFLYESKIPISKLYTSWKVYDIRGFNIITIKNRDSIHDNIDIRPHLRSIKIKRLRYGT